MAVRTKPKGAGGTGGATSAVDSQHIRRPARRQRWSAIPTWATLVGWPLLFVGQRVLDAEEGWAKALTGLAVVLLIVGLGFAILTVKSSPADRRPAARALAWLSGIGMAAMVVYFATTDWGRELLSIQRPKLGQPDTFGDIAGVLWLGLLAICYLATVLGELARLFMQRAERVESRRVTTAAVAGATLAVAATYGSLFVFAAGKYDVSADFSYFRTARPSESTQRMVDSLEEPIQALMFFPEVNEVGKKVEGYLRELAKGTDKLEIERYDRLLRPEVADENKVRKDGVVVLVRDKSRQVLDVGTDIKKAARTLKKLDGEFQKVLLKAMRGQRTAYLTVGHGELNESTDRKSGRTATELRKHLESQHYRVKNLGLSEGLGSEVPDDATIVLVLGPTQPFMDEEVGSLQRYADRGGHLLLALDPEADVDLDPLAGVAGVSWQQAQIVHDKILLRRRRNDSDKGILVAKRFSSHASVSTLSKLAARGAAVVFPGAAPLDKREGTDSSLRVDWAVKSVAGSYIDLNGDFTFDQDAEKRGTYNLIAAVSRPPAGKKKADQGEDDATTGPAEMRAFVVGDADLFSDVVLTFSQTNVLLFLEAVRWLGGEESFTGDIQSEEDVQIVHTKSEDQIWFYSTIIVAPALVLGGGLLLTRRGRRSKRSAPRGGDSAAKGRQRKGDSSAAARQRDRSKGGTTKAKPAKRAAAGIKQTIPDTPSAKQALKEAAEEAAAQAKAERAARDDDEHPPSSADGDDEDKA